MKKFFILIILCFGSLITRAQEPKLFNSDWKFILGDNFDYLKADHNDSNWRTLNLPHDWSIEGEYSQDHGSDGKTGYLPYGKGWYRKTFHYKKPGNGGRLFIRFDGIYMDSEVWINNLILGRCPYGYTSFVYDLTPFLEPDGKNTIAVRVNTPPKSARWYTGSGIYRNVWLIETPAVYIDHWEPYFTTPVVTNNEAIFEVEAKITNKKLTDIDNYTFKSQLIDRNGNVVSELKSTFGISSLEEKTIKQKGKISNPQLWSPETPSVYSLRTSIEVGGKEIQHKETMVGIRSLVFDNEKGFLLNGKPTKFKGVNDHHTAGCVGAAVPIGVWYRKMKLLKEMGCNAIRTAHNPFEPEFYTMCDTMGFMVMDEAFDGFDKYKAEEDYGRHFQGWWDYDLSQMILRDRNHPSIVMWSIGNEVQMMEGRWPYSQKLLRMTPDLDPTREIQKKLVELCHKLDPTRPVTQGWGTKEFSKYLDIVGLNGSGETEGEIEATRAMVPYKLIVGTEVPHNSQTRGVYHTKTVIGKPDPFFFEAQNPVYKYPDLTTEELFADDTVKTYFYQGKDIPVEKGKGIYRSSYGNNYTKTTIRRMWQLTTRHDYFIGMFRWGGFDYLGESRWPSRFSNGVIDIAGFPKDGYYLYKSLWTGDPMVHVLPHWTHPGKEGVEIPVMVYTNCDQVELFIGKKSLGKKKYQGEDLVWLVPYKKGTVKAIGYRNGKAVASDFQTTASEPAKIGAKCYENEIRANGTDVIHVEVTIQDENGVMVPKATNMVNFEVSGPVKIIGVDNGDPVDLSPYKVNHRRAFRGKCLAILQSTGEQGTATIKITSDNLQPTTISVKI